MAECSKKACIVSTLIVFVFMMAYGWLIHGHLLMALYNETPALWRTQAEMESFFPWCFLPNVLLSIFYTCTYSCWKKKLILTPDPKFALGYGVFIGITTGLMQAYSYYYMPISLNLALAWFLAYFAQGVLIGVILGCTFKQACKTA